MEQPIEDEKILRQRKLYCYRFSQGEWSIIDDPLAGRTLESAHFDSPGSGPSGRNLVGFGLSLCILSYLPPKGVTETPAYKFCALLDVASILCYIWVPDLPDLIQLLQLLQAKHSLQDLDQGPWLPELLSVAHAVLNGEKSLKVKLSWAEGTDRSPQ